MRKHTLALAFAALLFSASAVSVEAAEYPVKPIQVIVPWPRHFREGDSGRC